MDVLTLIDDWVLGVITRSYIFSNDRGLIAILSCTAATHAGHRAWIAQTQGLFYTWIDIHADIAAREQEDRDLRQFFRHRQLAELRWSRGDSSDEEFSPASLAERRGYDF